ncbi:hypothetical protein [Microcoleus sp. herbarium12]|uniref:hypothetical protein n=1 Tax=Microcoleus sp. herbarium12 TaxID=3055437 RepID=UPI002FD1BA12
MFFGAQTALAKRLYGAYPELDECFILVNHHRRSLLLTLAFICLATLQISSRAIVGKSASRAIAVSPQIISISDRPWLRSHWTPGML